MGKWEWASVACSAYIINARWRRGIADDAERKHGHGREGKHVAQPGLQQNREWISVKMQNDRTTPCASLQPPDFLHAFSNLDWYPTINKRAVSRDPELLRPRYPLRSPPPLSLALASSCSVSRYDDWLQTKSSILRGSGM